MIPMVWLRHVQRHGDGLSPNAVRVASAVAVRANKDGVCFPSMGTLAADLRVARKTVNRGIQELRMAGWLLVMRRNKGPDGRDSNRYLLVSQAVDNDADDPQERGGKSHSDPWVRDTTTQTSPVGKSHSDPLRSSPIEVAPAPPEPDVDNVRILRQAIGGMTSHTHIPDDNEW